MDFDAYLTRLHAVYRAQGEPLRLAAPASAAALDALSCEPGIQLPLRLRDAWLAANGSLKDQVVFAKPGYLTGYSFLSVRAALAERTVMRERALQYGGYREPGPRDARIRAGWFHDGWLPFAGFGGGTLLLLVDASPTPRGRAGQIIAFAHDPDEIGYVCQSFDALLPRSITTIERDPADLLGYL